ncbi:MAG: sigma-70 family RNA polymerase sigma factor [Pseudomonadota bacterium]
MSNDQLVQLLAQTALKNQVAFSELYQHTSSKLYSIALRHLKRTDWAEEVLQECFVSIWHRAIDYRSGSSAPLTWMSAIVKNRSIDWLRRPHYEEPDVDGTLTEALADDALGPLDQLVQTGETAAIVRCLQELETKQKQLINFAFFDGLSHSDLAKSLKIPLGTVKSAIRRGLIQLKGCLSL